LIDYDQLCGVTPQPEETTEPADWEITVRELREKLDRREPLTIIDVRDPHEWQICDLEPYGSQLIPLGQFAARMHELNSADDIVVHCKWVGVVPRRIRFSSRQALKRSKTSKGGYSPGRIRWTTPCRSIKLGRGEPSIRSRTRRHPPVSVPQERGP
jgi:rhodanese-related sulfurtransferase